MILNQEIKTAFDITYGDVSGDGNITAGDATLILRYVVGLIQMFPVEVQ
ncbi:dockerin type I domain-containing protein [Petroclostridium sp. X23]|nr:dockerin type I domain-containing protein [Petroclostridium sp. X23]WHH57904.1 dockerin type I domain-containing protein [Petroclostridium sp. X23]